MDADPQPSLPGNGGIPAIVSTFIDPTIVETLFTPNRAVAILGREEKRGSWAQDSFMIQRIEETGDTVAYDDYSEQGGVQVTPDWENRDVYRYQTMVTYGELEQERYGLAMLPYAAKKQRAAVNILDQDQNKFYFYGVSGLKNYGLLNDPALPAPITPLTVGGNVLWKDKQVVDKYNDILALYEDLVARTNGIPAGSSAIDTNGYIYQSINEAVIPASGTVDVQFVNTTTGPISCAASALNQIYRAVSGWDSITNASPGVVGVDVESRIAFETRRKQSVARNSRNQDASTLSKLLETSGVLDAYVWSNRTAATVNKGTTSFPVQAHSIFICVYGGADEDVAESIFQTYNPGANMNGSTHFTVYDNVNYLPPYPEYDMQWQKATPARVYFNVELDSSLNPPSDITSQVKTMIANVFNGGYEGIGKARIGSTINAGKYYAPVISISPDTVGILSLEVSLDGTTFGPAATMGIDQVPTIQESDINVTLS